MNELEFKEQLERDGSTNMSKYFDRLHDKLFNINAIILSGYLVIVSLPLDTAVNIVIPDVSIFLWPLTNIAFMCTIDYVSIEKSRKECMITESNDRQINAWKRHIHLLNVLSLCALISTFTLLIIFLNLFTYG